MYNFSQKERFHLHTADKYIDASDKEEKAVEIIRTAWIQFCSHFPIVIDGNSITLEAVSGSYAFDTARIGIYPMSMDYIEAMQAQVVSRFMHQGDIEGVPTWPSDIDVRVKFHCSTDEERIQLRDLLNEVIRDTYDEYGVYIQYKDDEFRQEMRVEDFTKKLVNLKKKQKEDEEVIRLESGAVIRFGPPRYTTEGARYLHQIAGKEIFPLFQARQQSPSSVQEALILDSIGWYFQDPNVWDYLIKNEGIGSYNGDEWVGKTPQEVLDMLVNEQLQEPLEYVTQRGQLIEKLDTFIEQDSPYIQLVIAKDTTQGDLRDDAYSLYVVYPSQEREFSMLTQGCQTLNIAILFNKGLIPQRFKKMFRRKPNVEVVQCNEREYEVRKVNLENLSDEELTLKLQQYTQRRTQLDKAIQRFLGFRDKLLGRRGQHVDALKTIMDRNYAKIYALATHRGIPGVVENHRVTLPPVDFSS